MARLHESRRPLVVSFRRKKPQFQQKQVTIFDREVQDTLDGLKDEVQLFGDKNDGNRLQPAHICPLNEAFPLLEVEQEANGKVKLIGGTKFRILVS